MKDKHQDRCPGCGKHCPMNAVRCKYGRKYFSSHTPSAEPLPSGGVRMRKWEKYVSCGGTAWQLLCAAKGIKRDLRDRNAKEDQLLSALTEDEQRDLSAILQKLILAQQSESAART